MPIDDDPSRDLAHLIVPLRKGTRELQEIPASSDAFVWLRLYQIEFEGLVPKGGVEVVYLITSADHRTVPPHTLSLWVRERWGIENKLHWVRDVTYGEDMSQVRTGQSPRVMAACRNLAVSLLRIAGWGNIAAGLRHHARHPDQALTLVLT